MIGSGRTVGIILIVVGLVICLVASLFIGSGMASGRTTLPATILGIGLFGIIPLALFAGVGAYLFVKGGTEARELAEVRLNGKSLGIVWAPPFRVEISGLIRSKSNRIEIEVVNFWPNRIIGDQFLPADRRSTRTNIRKLTKETALMESGLLGPVRILRQP